jgi:hypothetical protein
MDNFAYCVVLLSCTFYRILSERSDQGGQDGRDMWHA